jgi:serine protease Do
MRTFSQFGLSLAAAAVITAPVALSQTPAPQPPPAAPRAHAAGVPVQMITYLGVACVDLDPARRQMLKIKEDRGIEVTVVEEGTPAEKAGLKLGDIILEFNGRAVESFKQLRGFIQDSTPGKAVQISISRNGAAQTLKAVPTTHRVVMMAGDEWPEPMIAMPAPAAPMMPVAPEIPRLQTIIASTPLGILGEELSEEPQFAEFFGVKEGVLIKNVRSGSLADKAGMKAGDVLLRFDENHIASARDLQRAIRTETKSSFPVTVMRNRKETVLTVNP